jgi:NodT family efflux transporter outer membrane factor (OMF) lipoprotein
MFHHLWFPAVLIPVLMLSACFSTGTQSAQPSVQLPDRFSQSGAEIVPSKWWLAFNDTQLNTLIAQALADNPGLLATWSRLEQARALARKSGAPLRPGLDASSEVSRSWSKQSTNSSTSQLSLGLTASYELDLWGRLAASRDAAVLDAEASYEDIRAAAIALSAQVAVAWFQLVDQRAQISLLYDQYRTNEQHLELITVQFQTGAASASDVLQQRQTLERSRANRLIAESNEKVIEHQLAALMGKPAGSIVLPRLQKLAGLPPLPTTGIPAELIQQRPDVRKAFLLLQSADRKLAAAIADQFPRISLQASASTADSSTVNLFQNWAAALAGNLVMPLIDGGRRKAEVDRSRAAHQELLYQYTERVLTAVQEVEDALIREQQQQSYVESLAGQSSLLHTASEQIRDRYMYGSETFLRFLTTLLSYQDLQRSELQAQEQLIEYRISLYRALAGGWDVDQHQKAGRKP